MSTIPKRGDCQGCQKGEYQAISAKTPTFQGRIILRLFKRVHRRALSRSNQEKDPKIKEKGSQSLYSIAKEKQKHSKWLNWVAFVKDSNYNMQILKW